jgi:hypothetical protein
VFKGWRLEGTRGLRLEYWGNALVEENDFYGMSEGVIMNESYSNTIRRNRFSYFASGGIAIHPLSSCMHLVATNNGMYSVANAFKFEAKTYSINLLQNDMEGGTTAISVPYGGGSFLIDGSHIEGQTSVPIFFGPSMEAVIVRGGFIGYNTGNQAWTNIVSGLLEGVTFGNQSQTITESAAGLTVGVNQFLGTSNKIYSRWTAPTLLNGFANTGGSYANAGYRKNFDGTVRLLGMVQATDDAIALTLPEGFRPSKQQVFPAFGSTGVAVGKVVVSPTGDVACYRTDDSTLDLSTVSFVAGG